MRGLGFRPRKATLKSLDEARWKTLIMVMMRMCLNCIHNAHYLAQDSTTNSFLRSRTPTPARSGGCRHPKSGLDSPKSSILRLDPPRCLLPMHKTHSQPTMILEEERRREGIDSMILEMVTGPPEQVAPCIRNALEVRPSWDRQPSSTPVPFSFRPSHTCSSLASQLSPSEF